MRKKIKTLPSALALLSLIGPGLGLWAEEGRLEVAGSALWSKAYDVEVRGNLAYCAFLNGLLILDITDRKNPVSLSQLYLAGKVAAENRGVERPRLIHRSRGSGDTVRTYKRRRRRLWATVVRVEVERRRRS